MIVFLLVLLVVIGLAQLVLDLNRMGVAGAPQPSADGLSAQLDTLIELQREALVIHRDSHDVHKEALDKPRPPFGPVR